MSALAEALVAAQAELPLSLRRDADGQIGERGYRYVTFDALVEATRPILTKHGICITQEPGYVEKDGKLLPVLTTRMECGDDRSGFSTPLILPQPTMQGLGAAITYARRYAWAAALGIASEEDDDAASVSGQSTAATKASDAQVARIQRDLRAHDQTPLAESDLRNLSKARASELIDSLAAGTYDPSAWDVPF